jgi:hypothetical protein
MASLHCLYEDLKLTVSLHSEMPRLARLLLALSSALSAPSFSDYYVRHHPEMAALPR